MTEPGRRATFRGRSSYAAADASHGKHSWRYATQHQRIGDPCFWARCWPGHMGHLAGLRQVRSSEVPWAKAAIIPPIPMATTKEATTLVTNIMPRPTRGAAIRSGAPSMTPIYDSWGEFIDYWRVRVCGKKLQPDPLAGRDRNRVRFPASKSSNETHCNCAQSPRTASPAHALCSRFETCGDRSALAAEGIVNEREDSSSL